MAASPHTCYEARDPRGEPICGLHNQLLIPRRRESQSHDTPWAPYYTELICPVSREPLRYLSR